MHVEVLPATLASLRGGWWLRPSAEVQGEPAAVSGEAAGVLAVVRGLVRTDV